MSKISKKVQNYLNNLPANKLLSIQNYIDISNLWLKENRPGTEPIGVIEVVKRLLSSSSRLSIESDSKTKKGSKNGYLTGILYLAPYNIVGFNLCPFAVTCKKDCLFNSGRGRFGSVSRARIIKTLAFLLDRALFEAYLIKDINKLKKDAKNKNMIPVVRLNGTSDLSLERVFSKLFKVFKDIQFYDYTKNYTRFYKKLPENYDLTFSFDGVNLNNALNVLKAGGRVAVVFKNGLPDFFMDFEVVNGDSTDLRFLDKGGVIIGLNAKGSAKTELADNRFIVDKNDSRCFNFDTFELVS